MNYTDIWTKIYNIVNANTLLAAAYNYDKKTLDEFPVACISASTNIETILDTATNQGIYSFIVRAYDQNTDIENMEARMRTLCDWLMTDLRGMPLDNTVSRLVMNVKWGWTDDEQPLRTFEIQCDCLSLNSV